MVIACAPHNSFVPKIAICLLVTAILKMRSMIDVKKVAELARLHITPEEEKQYQTQLSAIFKYFEEVAQIQTENVEPLVTPSDIEQVWRADEAKTEITTEEALMNAPEKSGQLFRVPPVV